METCTGFSTQEVEITYSGPYEKVFAPDATKKGSYIKIPCTKKKACDICGGCREHDLGHKNIRNPR